jgi:Phage-related minor tail protein
VARKIDQLYFEIRAQIEGLSGDLDDATRQLGKLETFISAHPIAAAAALSAALVEIGKKAVDAAEETDTSMRAIAVSIGAPLDNLKELEDRLDSIAIAAGRATSEVQAAAVQAAQERPGTSPQDVGNVVEAATLFSDATNTQLAASVSLLDQVMREFRLNSGQAVDVLAQIDAAAKQGHVSVQDLSQAFVSAAPTVVKLGLDLNTTLRAITAMAEAGLSGQKIGRIFRQDDVDSIKEWADRATLAANATEQLTADAETARSTASRASQAIRDELNVHLRELGDLILPPLNTGLGLLVSLLEHIPKLPNLGSLLGFAGPVGSALGDLYNLLHPPAQSAPAPSGLDLLRGLGNPGINSYAPAAPEPLTTAQKTQIANDLASIQKLVTDFGNSTSAILAGVTKSAVDTQLNELDTFSQKFDQTRTELENKLRQLQSTTPNLPPSVTASFDAQFKALLTAYTSGIQVRLDAVNALAAKEADDLRAKIGQALGSVTGDVGTVGLVAIQQQNDKLRDQVALADGLTVAEKDRLSQELNIVQALESQKAKAQDVLQQIQQAVAAARTTAITNPAGASTQFADATIKANNALLQMIQDGRELAKQTPDYQTIATTLSGIKPIDLENPETAAQAENLKGQLADILANADAVTKSGDGYKAILAALPGLTKEQQDALKALLAPHKDVEDSVRNQLQSTIEMARAIQEAVTGALQLGEAFGILDARAASVLGSISQVVTNIPALSKSLEVFNIYGANKDLLNVVGAALPIVGGIASLVSSLTAPNPQEQAHIKALQDNSVAIETLTQRVASLNLSGATLSAGSALVNQFLSRQTGELLQKNFGHGAGVDAVIGTAQQLQQLNDFAKSLGLTFDGSVESLRQLQQAAEAAGIAIGKMGTDAQSTSDYYSGLSTAEGLTGVDKFNVDALGLASQSPFLAQLLGGFDLTTQAGRDAAKAALLAAYQRGAPNSTNPFTSDELGGLDITQMEQGLLQWMQELGGLPPLLGDAADATGDLSTSAEDAAAALADAAQKISDAEQAISASDDILGTSPTDSVGEYATAYGIDLSGFDLTTKSGVDAAITMLQNAFQALQRAGPGQVVGYDEKVREIQSLVDKLRQLPAETAAGAAGTDATGGGVGISGDASSGASGSNVAESNAATVATQSSVDRLGDYLATLLEVSREELALWTKYLTGITTPIITGPLLPPSLPSGFGASSTSSTRAQVLNTGPVTNVNLGGLSITLPNAVVTGPADIDALAQKLLPILNKGLATLFRNAQKRSGSTALPPS